MLGVEYLRVAGVHSEVGTRSEIFRMKQMASGAGDGFRTRDLQIMSNALFEEAGAITRLSFQASRYPGAPRRNGVVLDYLINSRVASK